MSIGCPKIRVVPNKDEFEVVYDWGDNMMKDIPLGKAKTPEEAKAMARACVKMHNALSHRISGVVNLSPSLTI